MDARLPPEHRTLVRDHIQDAIAVLIVNADRLTDAHLCELHGVFRAALLDADGFPKRHVDLLELESDLQACREYEADPEPDFVERATMAFERVEAVYRDEARLDERDRVADINHAFGRQPA